MSTWGSLLEDVNHKVESDIDDDDEELVISHKRLSRKERKELMKSLGDSFKGYPFLLAVKPRESMLFRSDYFDIDSGVGCVLGFFHSESAHDALPPFWGVMRIPGALADGVTAVFFEQVSRQTEAWVKEKMSTSETIDNLNMREQDNAGSRASKRSASKVSIDLDTITAEIQDGAAYLSIHNRILIKAPTLKLLESTIEDLKSRYIDTCGSLTIAAYPGEQRQELTTLFAHNTAKRGKGFYMTSPELAGSFHLVTNGINDPTGEYVGYMVGDLNNSAAIIDLDKYHDHIIVAEEDISNAKTMNRAYVSDMWGSKISQACLLKNKRVVHIILDGANLAGVLGPRMENITTTVDLSHGDVNPFEIFGERKDQLSLFPAHLRKIVLMAEQAYETTEADRSVIRASLERTLTDFYVDRRMWHLNTKDNSKRLRIVGIPHDQVPRLQLFVTYLDREYKTLENKTARDDERLHAYSILSAVFTNLLNNNGDLFNTYTADTVDNVNQSRRVIYDFSSLMRRGKGIAMAQLVNILAFAVGTLGEGDSVIIHGTEYIDKGVKSYINEQFDHLRARGGRVVYLYNKIDTMLEDANFNRIDKADYTILGAMSDSSVTQYQKVLQQSIPVDMVKEITQRGHGRSFFRREETNVVFARDLALGVKLRKLGNAGLPGMMETGSGA